MIHVPDIAEVLSERDLLDVLALLLAAIVPPRQLHPAEIGILLPRQIPIPSREFTITSKIPLLKRRKKSSRACLTEVQRFKTLPFPEESEEIRLELLELLRVQRRPDCERACLRVSEFCRVFCCIHTDFRN